MKSLLFALALGGSAVTASAQLTDVDLVLLLGMDISGSVSSSEYLLQRDGYANAFNSTEIQSIFNAPNAPTVAASFYFWASGAAVNPAVVPFTLITNGAEAAAFGNTIGALARDNGSIGGGTNLNAAINGGVELANDAALLYNAGKVILDLSGDGGSASTSVRDAALAENGGPIDVINGIVLEFQSVFQNYQNTVIGGPDAFALFATTFDEFEEGIIRKLNIEISTVVVPGPVIPEPSTIAFVALGGLFALILVRRARRA